MGRRITIVTAGHLATTPRMVKAADALHAAGYAVRVVSVQHTDWARRYDEAMQRRRGWRWDAVDYASDKAPLRWAASGAVFKAAATIARAAGSAVPTAVAARAFGRVHDLLVAAILREPSDLIYGGTTGALAATAAAGRRSHTPFAIDFEDFHCGEHAGGRAGSEHNRLAGVVMRDVAGDAAFVTAGSAAIAAVCRERFERDVTAIHNTFPLPAHSPAHDASGPIRFYWFSQTIGPGRGLEDVVRAAGAAGAECELHLQGVSANGYVDRLKTLAASSAPAMRINLLAPADPDAMIDACRPFTIGLATEPADPPNRGLCLTNKALTYPLAGLPVIMTTTPGQQPLAADLGPGALTYTAGDADGLASQLQRWMVDPRTLAAACEASWEAARTRWHWEHAKDRGALLACVERTLA